MGDDTIARAVALVIIALFVAAQVISYLDRSKPVPPESYPLVTMAVGYLLGHRFLKGNNNGEGK